MKSFLFTCLLATTLTTSVAAQATVEPQNLDIFNRSWRGEKNDDRFTLCNPDKCMDIYRSNKTIREPVCTDEKMYEILSKTEGGPIDRPVYLDYSDGTYLKSEGGAIAQIFGRIWVEDKKIAVKFYPCRVGKGGGGLGWLCVDDRADDRINMFVFCTDITAASFKPASKKQAK